MDLAFIKLDGGPTGRADPAFQAHSLPIGFWSMAVWNQWVPLEDLNLAVWIARNSLAPAAHPWRLVYGPSAATVATCARLDWKMVDASTIITDGGHTIDVTQDPPAVVKPKVNEAVIRWRRRRVEDTFPKMKIIPLVTYIVFLDETNF